MSDLSGNELIVPPPLSRMQTKKKPREYFTNLDCVWQCTETFWKSAHQCRKCTSFGKYHDEISF